MIRSHALYPAELTARAIDNYAIAGVNRQAILENFIFAAYGRDFFVWHRLVVCAIMTVTLWRADREAEGARLLSEYGSDAIWGSNPQLSARIFQGPSWDPFFMTILGLLSCP